MGIDERRGGKAGNEKYKSKRSSGRGYIRRGERGDLVKGKRNLSLLSAMADRKNANAQALHACTVWNKTRERTHA